MTFQPWLPPAFLRPIATAIPGTELAAFLHPRHRPQPCRSSHRRPANVRRQGPRPVQQRPAPGTAARPVTLHINGKPCTLQLEPRCTLLDALREVIHLTGAKKGCDRGQCGALHPMQAAFLAHDALQCGFCTPGQICSAVGMLAEAQAGEASSVQPLPRRCRACRRKKWRSATAGCNADPIRRSANPCPRRSPAQAATRLKRGPAPGPARSGSNTQCTRLARSLQRSTSIPTWARSASTASSPATAWAGC
ncbi:xanthine dehydrogenase iron-sulfur binding subunit [Cupriavidus sp. GA3-3]|nr:xanthine dehydrogenase iron-sulfur binding subunit [Cupriavidus sp. GA3-3]